MHCVLLDARRCAATFLENLCDVSATAATHIRAAAEAYREESGILKAASADIPFEWHPPERRLRMADPEFRQRFAQVVLRARKKEELALGEVESALATMTS